MKNYVLDACAIIAFIHDESGADRFENILNMANTNEAIAIACASVYCAELVTADHHELDEIESKENIKFLWIR